MAVDPVCGMKIKEKRAKYISEHQDQTYYFCSAECKKRFDKYPERYAERVPERTQ
jgi:Cu+-exporting ATPase